MTRRASAPAARKGAVLVAVVLGLAHPRPARAQSAADVETARAIFVEGAKLANQGRWEQARELYARSLQLRPAPITHYSLGVAEKETGHLAGALISFRAFLAEPPTPATAPYVAPARAAIAALALRIGRVKITIDPYPIDGLALTLDGQPAPLAPEGAREVDPGVHEVAVHAPGFRTTSARFSVAEGGAAAVAVTMTRAPEARSQWLPIILMGAGGAVFATGVIVGLAGVKQASSATTNNGPDAHAARAKGLAGDVMGGLGLATAGVGLVLFLTQGKTSAPAAGAVTLSTSQAGTGFQIRF